MKKMSVRRRIECFLDDWGVICFYAVIAIIAVCIIIIAIATNTDLKEGMVMNKYFSAGYSYCTDGKCVFQPDRWCIVVQNGEDKDWWVVTESYYDSVQLGQWVTK